MSWKAGLSRYLPCVRFFACPDSPSSRGVMTYYARNYDHLKILNPNLPLMIRTVENAMPAVTTELEWTIQDLLRFMIQTGRFRDTNGSISEARVEAAKAYLSTDWDKLSIERWKSPGFDPERPGLDEDEPAWKENPQIQANLGTFFSMKNAMSEQLEVIKSGPDNEYTRAENALLMCQRVDLWCAGEKEVEQAVIHLYKLGRKLNEREVELPSFIAEYYPGVSDMRT
jgi:hypothetical protein